LLRKLFPIVDTIVEKRMVHSEKGRCYIPVIQVALNVMDCTYSDTVKSPSIKEYVVINIATVFYKLCFIRRGSDLRWCET
jgi:hypothetical protein